MVPGERRSEAQPVPRSTPETPIASRSLVLSFAPRSTSRQVADALARRKATQEGRRPIIDAGAIQDPPEGQLPVDNEDLIREALAHRGTRYVWGGASRGGFDCSGFALYVYRQARGMNLPHHAADQARLGAPVARKDLRPGDLVFFRTRRGIGHVGIYVGNNEFIHAPNRRSTVRIDKLEGWYSRQFACARRLSPAPAAPSEDDLAPPGPIAAGVDPSPPPEPGSK